MFFLFWVLSAFKVSEDSPNQIEVSIEDEIMNNAKTFILILKSILKHFENNLEKQEVKTQLQNMLIITEKYIQAENTIIKKMSKLKKVIRELISSINWTDAHKTMYLHEEFNVGELYTANLYAKKPYVGEIHAGIDFLIDFQLVILAFDEKKVFQLQNFCPYLSSAIQIHIDVFEKLADDFVFNTFDDYHRNISIDLFKTIIGYVLKKKFMSYSEFQRSELLRNASVDERHLYSVYLNDTIDIYLNELESVQEIIIKCQKDDDILTKTLNELGSLFITCSYILKEPILQLREKKVDELLGNSLILIKTHNKKYENLKYKEDLADLKCYKSNPNIVETLHEQIIKVFSHTCEKCLTKSDENCVKELFSDLLKSMPHDLEENEFDANIYIKDKINIFISDCCFIQNNPAISSEELEKNKNELGTLLHKEVLESWINWQSNPDNKVLMEQILILEEMIIKIGKSKKKYDYFIHELNKKTRLRNEIEISILKCLYEALNNENKAEELLKFEQKALNYIFLICWNILESDYELLMYFLFSYGSADS